METANHLNIAFLSTYPPRECGIATFTQDIVREMKKASAIHTSVIAVSDGHYTYGDDVLFEIEQHNRESYIDAALKINHSNIDVLVVEHEYGIYGGDSGEYLLELINRVTKPIVATLHTVVPTPKTKQKRILLCLCEKSEKIVTMAANSKRILESVYGVDPQKVEIIHHGVPDLNIPSRDELKKAMGMEDRTIVSTFGLISEGKGLEYGIEAIDLVAKRHKEVLYLILGQTHPVVKRQFGEDYRERLERMVKERRLENNVRFINKYLTKEEIIRYLKLSDIYMTPYLGKDQAVSGTLAYAIGYGRVIVSTPYLYAEEMLKEGRGMLAKFKDAQSLCDCINYLIEHPEERAQMERRTLYLGSNMKWNTVTGYYIRTFFNAYHSHSKGSELSSI